MSEHYDSFEECVLDIMANTDAPFKVANTFAHLVYEKSWSYDNGPEERSVVFIPPHPNLQDAFMVSSFTNGGGIITFVRNY